MAEFLIYGANGYTGALTAREAVAHGLRPILAGRKAEEVAALARELGLEHRVFALDAPGAVEEGFRGMAAVLHCAGPFSRTWKPVADACLKVKAHYLDITGEAAVFAALAARDAEAKSAGVMLLPGTGFDVVPSDCLAAHLKRRLPTATHLALGFQSQGGQLSRGTATTMAENLGGGGLVREGGQLREVPAAWKTRTIDFGNGPTRAVTIPWGDVFTAYLSTGIPNIEVYLATPLAQRLGMKALRYLGWAVRAPFVQKMVKNRIRNGPAGPSDDERGRASTFLWGEAHDAAGHKVVSRLHGPEGYTLTARAALSVVARVLAGDAPPGFQTPSLAYGPDFVLTVEGITRTDEPGA